MARTIHATMSAGALFRVGAGHEDAFDGHVVEQPLAVGVLGDAADWPRRIFHNILDRPPDVDL